ncbi:MAG: pyruvate dehydrogenase (acetyl-transferring), homodimeric type [Acidobacteria bacterium]|nr:pyruvate dehydrogenase (acetyl-transferring), homodimeric type [Acidobacteriota bacterium]|tara:strand:- start:3468 stop:6134 length:2667 start_codon:yes stop_codon:yes gene_type:complete
MTNTPLTAPDLEQDEIHDWLDSLDAVIDHHGLTAAGRLLQDLTRRGEHAGVQLPFTANTPYVNSIPPDEDPAYPGDRDLEQRLKSLVRWNALAMVVKANREADGIGGHISTYASAATLYEVGFNHFFRAATDDHPGDLVYYQGHASPGVYARAHLEGRLDRAHLEHFRRELTGSGLSSYPHPWLMPDFWEFPTVSMGLSPIMGIYQARFQRYLEDRGILPPSDAKVWVLMGDGETDEPESLGAITLASREQLDNLIFVVNCNLQRLDGPVRGNGQIIQELEAAFRGAGWNVIKVLWGRDWDPLLAVDTEGLLVRRMSETVDGQYQRYAVESGAYVRDHFWSKYPKLLDMVDHFTDNELKKLRLGGHDPAKVYSAFASAVAHRGAPTVVLARTIKGYGLGEGGEGRNVTHQQKKLNEDELRAFRDRFHIPLSDEQIAGLPFYVPEGDSPEMVYLNERRAALGGSVPKRVERAVPMDPVSTELFAELREGTGDREISLTMAFARLLSRLLRDPEIGDLIVPIVPDEARTFGMEALFRQVGIYAHAGQKYEPVDHATLLYYREAEDGQVLEEGITEAGSIASFIAAGTAYSTRGVNTIPFFIFYSMFGFQRVGDLIWAAADSRCRGFLLGGTAGRTTLAGEGLQHQDGQSHLLAYPVPNLLSYDPAYAYELGVIIEEGIRRMYVESESVFYYLTVENQPYPMPPMPDGCRDGILKGLYRVRPSENDGPHQAQLLASGAILPEAIAAQTMLTRYNVAADVWSVTSWAQLYRDGHAADRWNLLHPLDEPRVPYVTQCLGNAPGVVVAASDYLKALPDSLGQWLDRRLVSLGTDGFGRSDTREALRNFFEVDARFITLATLGALARDGAIDYTVVAQAIEDMEIDPEKADPAVS